MILNVACPLTLCYMVTITKNRGCQPLLLVHNTCVGQQKEQGSERGIGNTWGGTCLFLLVVSGSISSFFWSHELSGELPWGR